MSSEFFTYRPLFLKIEKIHLDECIQIEERTQGTDVMQPAHNTTVKICLAAGYFESIY